MSADFIDTRVIGTNIFIIAVAIFGTFNSAIDTAVAGRTISVIAFFPEPTLPDAVAAELRLAVISTAVFI